MNDHVNQRTEKFFSDYDLGNSVADKSVHQDIKAAIEEAYITGCMEGGLDQELRTEAYEWACKHYYNYSFSEDKE